MAYLDDIAIRFQVYMEGLKAHDAREFNQVLALIEDEVRKELARGEMTELTPSQFEKVIQRVISNVSSHLDDAVNEWVPQLRAFAKVAYDFEAASLVAAAPAVELTKKLSMSTIYTRAKQRPMSSTGELLDPWIRKMTQNEVAAVEALMRKGRADGWTNAQISQVLKGTRANGYKDGLLTRMGRSNETLVKTTTQHVSSAARQSLWEENSDVVKRYRWVSTLDRKTSDRCRGLDGREFQLGDGPIPPIHLNCRSTTVAVLSKVYDVFDKGATRSSETGRVPQDQTYYEWLKKQDAEFIDSVLGPERGKLFRDGGLSAEEFTRLSLSSTFRPLTLDEMRRLAPLAFKRAGI